MQVPPSLMAIYYWKIMRYTCILFDQLILSATEKDLVSLGNSNEGWNLYSDVDCWSWLYCEWVPFTQKTLTITYLSLYRMCFWYHQHIERKKTVIGVLFLKLRPWLKQWKSKLQFGMYSNGCGVSDWTYTGVKHYEKVTEHRWDQLYFDIHLFP